MFIFIKWKWFIMSTRTEEAFDFDLSNRQNDRITNQINNIYDKAEMRCIGESRHEAKDAIRSDFQNEHGRMPTSHEMNSQMGVFSWSTEHKYKGQMHVFGEFCNANFGIKQLQSIKPEHLKSFFHEMADRGYSQKTFDSYCGTLEKWGVAMDKAFGTNGDFTRSEAWHDTIKECRAELKDEFVQLNIGSRAYDNPHAIVDSIQDPICRLVGSLQLECGLRVTDACKLIEIQKTEGIENSKGGQAIANIYNRLTPDQQTLLKSLIPQDCYGIKEKYTQALKESALANGEEYNGKATHGLRHNFAQYTYNGIKKKGYSSKEALLATSELMGHHRADITLEYLR